MKGTNAFYVAKYMADNIYGESRKLRHVTSKEEYIFTRLKNKIDRPEERDYARSGFFRKKIKRLEEEFLKPTSDIKKYGEDTLPKPVFRITDYSTEEQALLYKAYIENVCEEDEEKRPNRKSNYNYHNKIDIEQDYGFIMQVLKDLKPDIEYPNLNYNDEWPAKGLYYEYRKDIVKKSKERAKEYNEGSIKPDKVIFKDEYIQSQWNSRSDIHHYSIIYVFNLLDLCLDFKEKLLSDILTDFDYGIAQKKYHIRWNLWIFIIMQNFQYLFKHGFIRKSDTMHIINDMRKIRTTVQGQKDLKESTDIADAYFDYNHLLKFRTLLLEEIRFGCIRPKKHIFIKPEDLFLEESDIYAEYSEQELFDKLNSGKGKSTRKNESGEETEIKDPMKHFKRRLKLCKKFVAKYNELTKRKLNLGNNKVLRAVYRALYINPCEYNRMSSLTIARKIIDGDEIGSSKHYLLGVSISRELQLEEKDGKEFAEEKLEFMKVLYRLALDILYKSLPSVSASEECLNEAFNDLDEIMKKIVKVLYDRIKCPVD